VEIAAGIAAVLFVGCCVLGLLLLRLSRSYDELEQERDNLQNVLEGSGVIYSEIYDDDMLEQRYDRLLEQEAADEELPGHGARWDDSAIY
jgi:hypothetical protein